MATKIFHPTSDISLGHSLSTGSVGWVLLGSNDGDSTYINGRINSNNTVTHTSTFGFSGNFDGKTVIVNSLTAYMVARSVSSSSKDTKNYSLNLTINGSAGTAQSGGLSSSYATYSKTYTNGLPSNVIEDIGELNVIFQATISGKQESSKTDAFDNYITELYIVADYNEVTAYHCNAVAGANVTSASVNRTVATPGELITFTATVAQYYTFDGWYTAASGGTKVSSSNPYTMAINSDTTLYARSAAILYSANIGAQPAYGSAAVSSNANVYGASVTFTCTVTSSNKEFWGWYSDANHTQLVNESSTYVATQPASTLVLYPYIGDVRHYVTITCSHAMDVKPFRFNGNGDYNNGKRGESRSLIRNQNNIIGRTELDSGIFAQQSNYKYDSDFNFGISFHFVNGADTLPDNANIVGVTGHIGLATTAGTQYKNMSLFAGEMDYIEYNNSTLTSGQPDETAIVNRRGSAKTLTINAVPTDYVLTFEQMGTWTPNEIKNGRCGIELDFTHSGNQSDINIYLAKIEVVYTYNYTSYTCTAESNENCDVFVMDSTLSNPKYYDTDLVVTSGNQCTWFARPVGGYRFDGWYSDSSYNNLVSSTPTYTTTVTANKTLYAKTHYCSRVVSRELTVDFGKGDDYYQGYYSNDGTTRTATNAGSNGFQVNMDMTTGIYAFTGLDVTASLGSTNGKEYIYGLLNDAAKNVLFPNTTAHPVAMDWYNEAGRGAATIAKILGMEVVPKNPLTENETVSLVVGNEYVCHQRPSLIAGVSCTLTNLRDDYILNMTKSTDLGYKFRMTNASRSKAIGVNTSIYRLYFEEYDFSALAAPASRGIEVIATDKVIGYEGDSVTFSVQLLPNVEWHGWYGDANCTNLISTEQSYTCVPNANLTLYAYATTDLEIYNVSAVAGDFVKSVSCDHSIMTHGNSVKFSAELQDHCQFLGWYDNSDYSGNPVSTNVIYQPTIISDTILYAKAEQIIYSITLEQADGGLATATPSMGMYGTNSTLRWEDSLGWYEFNEWQIQKHVDPDIALADVYTKNPLQITTRSGTSDIPEAAFVLGGTANWNKEYYTIPDIQTCSVLWDGTLYTSVPISECNYYRKPAAGAQYQYVKVIGGKDYGYPFGFYSCQSNDHSFLFGTDDNVAKHTIGIFITSSPGRIEYAQLSTSNPYLYTITDNATIKTITSEKPWYYCTAGGEYTNLISVSAVQGHVVAGDNVTFSYNGGSAYTFFGWYSDEECTQLVSEEENYTFTPDASVVLYAKIQQPSTSTGIYIKQNGGYIVAKAVYKKENGTWVEQIDYTSIFDTDGRYKIRQ